MSDLALRFARAHRALRTIAVTGTNGKTTTTSMIEAIVAASGEPSARLTTLGASVAGELVETESASDEFLLAVERAVQAGVRTFALEVTSKALAFGFAQRWPPNIAVFTNLSHDHLEAHGSAEAYLASKAQLFMVLGETGTAVLNRDDPASAMIDEVTPASVRRLGYSLRDRDADLAALRVEARVDGTTLTLAPSPLANVLGDTLELLGLREGVFLGGDVGPALRVGALRATCTPRTRSRPPSRRMPRDTMQSRFAQAWLVSLECQVASRSSRARPSSSWTTPTPPMALRERSKRRAR